MIIKIKLVEKHTSSRMVLLLFQILPLVFLFLCNIPQIRAAEPLDETQLLKINDKTTLTLSAFRYNRRSRTYFGHATVTNSSTESLSTPIYLVVDPITPSSVQVIKAHGTTLSGKPYYDISALVSSSELAPGGATNLQPIEMNNPSRVQFQTNISIYTLANTAPANQPPEIDPIVDQIMDEGTSMDLPISASDPEGNSINISAAGLPSFAAFEDYGEGRSHIQFSPDYSHDGTYPITMTADDGELSDTVSFNLTVNPINRTPTIISLAPTSTTEEQSYRYDVEATDSDQDDTLTYTLHQSPVNMTIDPATGLINWTPSQVQSGDHNITVKVEDVGGLFATQSFTLNVIHINKAPVAKDDHYQIDQNTTLSIDALGILTNDTDPENDPLLANPVDFAKGNVLIKPDGSFSYSPGWTIRTHASDVSTVSGGGALAMDLNSGDLIVRSLQDPLGCHVQLTKVTQQGNVSILETFPDIQNSDLSGIAIDPLSGEIILADGGLCGVIQSRIVLVDLSDMSVSTLFDLPWKLNPHSNGTGQQQYAFDPSKPHILYFWDSTVAKLFQLDRNSNQLKELLAIDQQTEKGQHFTTFLNDIVFDPNTGTILLSDFSSKRILEVNPDTGIVSTLFSDLPGDPRAITYSPFSNEVFVIINAKIYVGLRDSGALSLVSNELPQGNWDITIGKSTTDGASLYAVNKQADIIYEISRQTGEDSFTYKANDGELDSNLATVFLNVNPVNNPPLIISAPVTKAKETEPYAYAVEAIDVDLTDSVLHYSLTEHPEGMLIGPTTGIISWTTSSLDAGDHTVTVRVEDGKGGFDEQTYTLTITVNKHPQMDAIENQSMVETEVLTVPVMATDPEGNAVTLSVTGLPAFAQFIDNGNNSGKMVFSPGIGDAGTYPVTITASDGDLSISVDFTLTVSKINRSPKITSSPITTATNAQLYSYDVEATDPDSDPLTFNLTAAPEGMTIDPATGLVEWTPDSTQLGNHDITVRVEDNKGLFDIQSYQISVFTDPDLTITDIDSNNIVFNGQANTVSGELTVTIENKGDIAVNESFQLLIFEDRNADGQYQTGIDSLLGEVNVADGLSSHSSKNVTATLSGSVEFAGSLIWGFVDSQNVIAESDESNNITNSSHQCTYTPPVGQFNPVVELHKDSFSVLPNSNNVMMTPAVIDLNEDGIPEIIFSTFTNDSYGPNGILRAIRGDNGEDVWNITSPEHEVNSAAGLAVGDIDLDGKPEIVARHGASSIIVFEHDGTFKWKSEPINEHIGWGGAAISDLDQDGIPEIIVGATVLNNDGSFRWEGSLVGGTGHANNQGLGFGPNGVQSVVADLDLDGMPEVIAGKSAFRADGSLYWNADIADGFPAIGNFDDDPFPEVVIVSSGNVYLLQHDGSIGWGPVAIPGNKGGGAPTIADMDGDGQPEIGIAGQSRFTVIETDGSIKWQSETQDGSSMTGSSVFDFDADGSAEIVYGDEFFLRIYRGSDGTVLYELPKGSGTTYEIPIVADVDGDGNAEIVAVANDYAYGSQNGIYVIGDANDTWVPTRQIWNQHSYHITNINDDGSIPAQEENSWLTHNTYRLNTLPESIGSAFSSPDLIASTVNLTVNSDELTITARIGNGGGIVVGEGIDIAFYDGDPASGGTLIATTKTTARIGAGRYEDVQVTIPLITITELWVSADDDGQGKGKVNECDELNNIYQSDINFNRKPEITSSPVLTVNVGKSYLYDVEATDPDLDDELTYSLNLSPEGMTIDPSTGLIQWIPDTNQLGSHNVVVRVEDNQGLFDTQSFQL